MPVVLVAVLLSCAAAFTPAETAPDATPAILLASVRTYEQAANGHDWQRVRPLLADAAVIDLGGDLALVGRESVRGLHDWEHAMATEIHYSECEVAERTVTCRATEQNDFLRLAGLPDITYTASRLTFQQGRVVHMSATLSDESAAAVGAYLQSFLAWASQTAPGSVSTFLRPDGSFAFGYEPAMTFKRLLRAYVRTQAGGARRG